MGSGLGVLALLIRADILPGSLLGLAEPSALLCGLHCAPVNVPDTSVGLNRCGQIFEIGAFHPFLGLWVIVQF